MANHEDVGCSEHQICLSKGVIAKFVQPLDLVLAVRAHAPVARSVGFAPLSLTNRFVGDRTGSGSLGKEKATAVVPSPQIRKWNGDGGFLFSLRFVTGTVSSFRIANRGEASGRFLHGFPMWELPCGAREKVCGGRTCARKRLVVAKQV
jgi:hypothetical protein